MSRDAAYCPSLWFVMDVRPSPISMPRATADMTEKIPPELGILEMESLRTLNGVELDVEDIVKLKLALLIHCSRYLSHILRKD